MNAMFCRGLHPSTPVRLIVSRRGGVACKAAVKFSLQKKVEFGDRICVVGSAPSLGEWNVDAGRELSWNDGDIWTCEVELPEEEQVEFKIVTVRGGGHQEWEDGENRTIQGTSTPIEFDLNANQAGLEFNHNGTGGHERHHDGAAASFDSDSGGGGAAFSDSDDLDRLPTSAWQGKGVEFMRENKHSKERSGTWDTSGLEGVMLELVQGDEKSGSPYVDFECSWLQKLDVAKTLLVDKSDKMRPKLDALAPVYIYLHWISTGSIPCVEGGGHYRPNRHAELSRVIFRSLEWVVGGPEQTPMERMTARRMQAKLPSFSESFTSSVPLTRIRDIAHRNDIPGDLKREIKHTLQNKLHRNAGPEDLVAAEEMLTRITSPGADYSGAFVDEFKVFVWELRDFFNAGSLNQMLEGVVPSMDEPSARVVQRFLDAKGAMEGKGGGASMNDVVDVMHQLTSVRAAVVDGLASGLRNDAPDDALAGRQRWRLADLRCEDYAFALAARFLNLLEASGGAAGLTGAHEKAWALPVGMLVLSVRQMGLSGWRPAECHALDEELSAWQKAGLASSRDETLRLKATLQRCQRLTDSFAQAQLDTFADRALRLGAALGMPQEIRTVFTEAEIRAHVAFQLSRVNALLLRACRGVLQAADYDALVLGEATGVLVKVECIEAGMDLPQGKPLVLLVKRATGDEEITTAGADIRGVVLRQDLPHLSHLGVRARQEQIAFATCTSEDAISRDISPLVGSPVRLSVTADAVSVSKAKEADLTASAATGANADGSGSAAASKAQPAKRVRRATVTKLADADVNTCGAKAAACGRLAALAAKSGSGEGQFGAPAGAVLPFGCMEAAVDAAGASKEFKSLLDKLESAELGAELDEACKSMQTLLRDKSAPGEQLLKQLQSTLSSDAKVVIARSSANVEDLAGMSGAGLYESVPNLDAQDVESLGKGVAEVWASLFSRRAVLSRRSAGIKQGDACMAVLVQEMLTPDLSFVLHTADPLTGANGANNDASVYAELAPGLGETLASGTEGSAWRMSIGKADSKMTVYSFANFSEAYMPVNGAARKSEPGASIYASSKGVSSQGQNGAKAGTVAKRAVDYSKQEMSLNEDARKALAKKLAAVGVAMEEAFDGAQDVEGAVVKGEVYVVQSRPQP